MSWRPSFEEPQSWTAWTSSFAATNSSCCCYCSCRFRAWVWILIVDLLQKSVPHTPFHRDLKVRRKPQTSYNNIYNLSPPHLKSSLAARWLHSLSSLLSLAFLSIWETSGLLITYVGFPRWKVSGGRGRWNAGMRVWWQSPRAVRILSTVPNGRRGSWSLWLKHLPSF